MGLDRALMAHPFSGQNPSSEEEGQKLTRDQVWQVPEHKTATSIQGGFCYYVEAGVLAGLI